MPPDPIASFRTAESALLAHYGLAPQVRTLPTHGARVLDVGEGPPTVFVHGGGAFGALWAPLAGALDGRRRLLLDRPGFGLSPAFDHRSVDLRRFAVDWLTAALDDLALPRVDLVANSMGGLWSLWLALERPERVRRIVLLGAPAFVAGGSAAMPMRLLGLPGVGPLMMWLESPSAGQVQTLWRRMGHDPDRLDAPVHDAMLAAERVPAYGPSWRSLMARTLTLGGPRPDVTLGDDALARLTVPTDLIWGRNDPFGDLTLARRAAAAIPGARLVERGEGHLPWLDDPVGTGQAVGELLGC